MLLPSSGSYPDPNFQTYRLNTTSGSYYIDVSEVDWNQVPYDIPLVVSSNSTNYPLPSKNRIVKCNKCGSTYLFSPELITTPLFQLICPGCGGSLE